MEINEYAKLVRLTAIYPSKQAFIYPTLGLSSEVGELLEKSFPGDREVMTMEVVHELGDVLWYVFAILADTGIGFNDIAEGVSDCQNPKTFGDVEWWLLDPPYKQSPYLRMAVHSGLIAGIAKKMIRDRIPIDDMRTKIQYHLGQVFYALCVVCKRSGVELDYVAKENYDKLNSRKDRGKLKGDGDNR